MPQQGKQVQARARAEKRAALLRENLRRRRQQQKERGAPDAGKRKEA